MNRGKLNIEINKTKYPLEFGYGSVALMGKYLGDDTYDGTVEKIQSLLSGLSDQEKKGKRLSFDMLNCLGFLVISGIENAEPDMEHQLKPKDVIELLFTEPELLIPVVEGFVDQMPKPKESKTSGNNQPPKRRRAARKG